MKVQPPPIECGEKTCAVVPGVFCRYVRMSDFGTKYSCHLFIGTRLEDKDGWLMRCAECLALPEVKT